MRIIRWSLVLLISILTGWLLVQSIACDNGGTVSDDGKIGIVVTLAPQAEFVEKLGGNEVAVTIMVPSGASPHTYEPTLSQMNAVSGAEIYAKVGSGVEFELAWMNNLIDRNKDMLVVDCSEGVELIEMRAAHDHENGEDHSHEGMDPHIWMSPPNAMIMVNNLCDGLMAIDPDNKTYYMANRDAYLKELIELDQDIERNLADLTKRVFMVYHPAFGYFAREYDLVMLAIEQEGKEPSLAGLERLIDQAREDNVGIIFVEPQFDKRNAEIIADEIGAEIVQIDPLAKNYTENLRAIMQAFIELM